MIHIVLALYNLAWHAALPFLKRSPRVRLGWQQRTLSEVAEGPFDLWIQAASGGESMLTNMVLENLAALLPSHKKWRILATSGTKQGIDSLNKGRKNLGEGCVLDVSVAYFPFDAPHIMDRAFSRIKPRLAIIVETELWPGFLISAKRRKIPVLLINGRMSEKSFQSYKYFTKFFNKYGPEKVLAISPTDQKRFAGIIGPEKVGLINNIKFDRIGAQPDPSEHNPIADLLAAKSPFLLLGSIRKEEEEKILKTVTKVLAMRSDITIGIFPKHIERADHWINMLTKHKITAGKRSKITDRQSPGSVIVWDVFGELSGAYALAKTAFVGGSLLNLGGQNFLEPLAFGLQPIIGPYWHDFSWIGRDIVTAGLVKEIADENELATELLLAIDADLAKNEVIKQVHDFFLPRTGGSLQACRHIIARLEYLENTRNN